MAMMKIKTGSKYQFANYVVPQVALDEKVASGLCGDTNN